MQAGGFSGLREGGHESLLMTQWGLVRTVVRSDGLPAKDRTSLAPLTEPHWQFLPSKRNTHVMPERNGEGLQMPSHPEGKAARWIDSPDHVQQDDQGVIYPVAVITVGKGNPQAGGLLAWQGQLDIESSIP